MAPLNLSARALAREMNVPPNRITEILNGDRSITAETAILLAQRFNNSARFWMNLQVAYDLAIAERNIVHAA
jgi:addiction module HigA family antidote